MLKFLKNMVGGDEKSGPQPAKQSDGNDGRQVKDVLLVDDDPVYVRALSRIAEKSGLDSVSVARDIEEAERLAAMFRYRTILLDHFMVKGNGNFFVRWLVSNNIADGSAIYVMSGEPIAELTHYYEGLPVAQFLSKPIGVNTLASLFTTSSPGGQV